MKKLLTILFICTMTIPLSAQKNSSTDTLKAREGDFGFTMDLTGLISTIALNAMDDINGDNAIQFKHFLKDKQAFRIDFGVHSLNQNWSTADSIYTQGAQYLETDSSFQRTDFSIAPGYEQHLGNSRRLDPYLGGGVVIGIIGKTKITSESTLTDPAGTATTQRIIQKDGGLALGLNLIAGFNYFFSERICIGAEYKLGYVNTTLGGDVSESYIENPVSGSQVSTFNQSIDEQSTSELKVNSTAGILLSFYF